MPKAISADFNRDATNDILHKPEHLYAYTDPNVSGETLYAWYCDFDGPSSSTIENRRTIYTKTPNPTTSTPIYDENGNVLNLGSSVSAASSSEITITY